MARETSIVVPASVVPFLGIGVLAVVAGGLVAAVSRPGGWERGPWVAAFLVLVVGVGQIGLALLQAIAVDAVDPRSVGLELAFGNVGAGGVLVGTLASSPVLVTVGSVLFLAAVGVFARQVRRRAPRWATQSYLALLGLLAVSTPVGIALSWLRA